jgi:hypothetical protein
MIPDDKRAGWAEQPEDLGLPMSPEAELEMKRVKARHSRDPGFKTDFEALKRHFEFD